MVDENKALLLLARSYGYIADCVLELDNFAKLVIDKAALRLNELLTLLGVRVEERRVDFSLFVLEGDVEGKDESVGDAFGCVRVSWSVLRYQLCPRPS